MAVSTYTRSLYASLQCTELVILTGASSGLGRKTAQALLRSGEYHVIGAVRDLDKMEAVAEMDEFNMENFTDRKSTRLNSSHVD